MIWLFLAITLLCHTIIFPITMHLHVMYICNLKITSQSYGHIYLLVVRKMIVHLVV